MEHLPNEVLVLILDKLAWQDTPSSLRATWACKTLYIAGKEASHIWKRAFLTPLTTAFENVPKLPSEELCKLEEDFDAEVEALGGFKLLLAAALGHAIRVKKALSKPKAASDHPLIQGTTRSLEMLPASLKVLTQCVAIVIFHGLSLQELY